MHCWAATPPPASGQWASLPHENKRLREAKGFSPIVRVCACVRACTTLLISPLSVFVFLRLVAPLITERAIYQSEEKKKKKQFTMQPVLPLAWIRIDFLSRRAP